MRNTYKVICLVGPSGVGKTSFAKRLVDRCGLVLSPVVTTRSRRSDDDSRYQYISEVEFLGLVGKNYFIEWDKYTDYYYGTPAHSIPTATCEHYDAPGVILDLTPTGCLKVKAVLPKAVIIALLPDDPVWLEKRLVSRNSQSPLEIETRLKLLQGYLREIERLNCERVYVSFDPSSWDTTFEVIARIVQ